MSANPSARLSFLPWVRQGAAAAITAPDTRDAKQPAVASVNVTLKVNGGALAPTAVRLRGPADVVGIDANQVVRTDPRPGSVDFEPTCFASIEFDRADFAWLFTPAAANANAQLRPWLCLVVIRKQDGVKLSGTPDAPLAVLQISLPAKPFDELPDLRECWAWAHAQAAASDSSPTAVQTALDGSSQLSLSRLVCPRALTADTDYIACVVPTFELGRKSGLGIAVSDADLAASNALAPSWTLTKAAGTHPAGPKDVTLPVYYHWEFRTGPEGDFKTLARRLKSATPAGLGQRTVNIGHPGFTLPAGFPTDATVALEGALQPLSVGAKPALWTGDVATTFETALAGIVNVKVSNGSTPPLLQPPLYGRWHAGRKTVSAGAAKWLDELNLDPRWRVAAAVGTRVVQDHQEALMASAWEQAAEMQHVNQRVRQLQLSLAVGESLYARHLSAIDTEEKMLRIGAPAFSRVRVPVTGALGQTLTAKMTASAVPVPATRAAMRRIGRQRGPLTRRIAAQGFTRSPDMTWVAALNLAASFPAPPAPPAFDFANATWQQYYTAFVSADTTLGFIVYPETQVMTNITPGWRDTWGTPDLPGYFRSAAAQHMARLRIAPTPYTPFQYPSITTTRDTMRAQMQPRAALAKLAKAVITTGDNVLPPTATGVTAVGLETVMMAPSFPQPMYEPLKELSQDLLLPGLEAVGPDTVVGLETNHAFVDAYMVGLNFEMARELLWRGFPTDQRGTYFKNFWGYDARIADGGTAPVEDAEDIDDLLKWGDRPLGASTTQNASEQFVLLLRSSLLKRYPNALIYMTPAVTGGSPAPDVFPLFNGALDPDISFFGFAVSADAAVGTGGSAGYYVVIQEHPTEPRFGLDGKPPGNASHWSVATALPSDIALRGLAWGSDAAQTAGITRRVPVRVAIHASQLVARP